MILVLSDALCMISETLSKPEISSIFHFDRVCDGQMAHVLGVKAFSLSLFYENCLSSNWSFYLGTVQRIHFTLSLHKTAAK